MKRTPLRRKSLKPRVKALGLKDSPVRLKMGDRAWIKAIPYSKTNHGAGVLQKRLWTLTSHFVRIGDWHKYKVCVATGKKIEHWSDGQAGHFRPYSTCRGIFKFDTRNIFLQSASSNGWGGYDDWIAFENEVIRRTGMDRKAIDKANLEHELKLNDSMVIEKMKEMLEAIKYLPEQPAYFERAYRLLQEETN